MTDEAKDAIRRAQALAHHPLVRRPRERQRFVAFAAARPQDRVLDVACGAGFNALAFARCAASVIGLDPSAVLLEQGWREAARRRLTNVSFQEGEAQQLPFPDNSFDIVTCAAAVHHFPSAEQALAEMVRVCRPSGKVAIEDIVTSEQEVRARYHNRLERLRDRSHRRCLKLSDLVSLLGQAGLEIQRIEVRESIREFNEWVAVAATPPRRAEHVRRLMIGSIESDLSGLSVRTVDDTLLFSQRVAWILAIKPA